MEDSDKTLGEFWSSWLSAVYPAGVCRCGSCLLDCRGRYRAGTEPFERPLHAPTPGHRSRDPRPPTALPISPSAFRSHEIFSKGFDRCYSSSERRLSRYCFQVKKTFLFTSNGHFVLIGKTRNCYEFTTKNVRNLTGTQDSCLCKIHQTMILIFTLLLKAFNYFPSNDVYSVGFDAPSADAVLAQELL